MRMISKENWIALTTFIFGALALTFYSNYYISLFVFFIQVAALLYFFFKNKMEMFLILYVIFLSTSLELSGFISSDKDIAFYGFKNFSFFRVNAPTIILIIFLFLSFIFKRKKEKIEKNEKSILFLFIILAFFPLVTGIITMLLNDNNIRNLSGAWSLFLGSAYQGLWPLLFVILITFFVKITNLTEKALKGILFGFSLLVIYTYVFNIKGFYGGLDTLLLPLLSWFIPFQILFLKSIPKKISEVINLLVVVVSNGLLLVYNSNGKIILFYMIIAAVILFRILMSKSEEKYIMLLVFCIAAVCGIFFVSMAMNSSILLREKVNSLLSMLYFWEPDWVANMPMSPRVRIIELQNIFYEFKSKPGYILFGKGYLGTVKDHVMGFPLNDTSAFSVWEWNNNLFFNMHEYVILKLLNGGIFGLAAIIVFVFKNKSRIIKEASILMGMIWLVLIFNYALTISVYAIYALLSKEKTSSEVVIYESR